MSNNTAQALSIFKERFSCSQAVFAAYAPGLGVDYETAMKLAAPFGAGIGRMAETCGAVTGALMALGLKYADPQGNSPEAKEKMHALVREFVARFRERNDSIVCKELLDCDISTPEGMMTAKEKDFHNNVCTKFVQDACEILEQMGL